MDIAFACRWRELISKSFQSPDLKPVMQVKMIRRQVAALSDRAHAGTAVLHRDRFGCIQQRAGNVLVSSVCVNFKICQVHQLVELIVKSRQADTLAVDICS